VVDPIVSACISLRQRGQLRACKPVFSRFAAAAPQRWQCLLPRNIIPKQEAQAMVASLAPQYLHSGSSVDVAAPHIGQLSVSAFIERILTVEDAGSLEFKSLACLLHKATT
jgi:hypothetical protein